MTCQTCSLKACSCCSFRRVSTLVSKLRIFISAQLKKLRYFSWFCMIFLFEVFFVCCSHVLCLCFTFCCTDNTASQWSRSAKHIFTAIHQDIYMSLYLTKDVYPVCFDKMPRCISFFSRYIRKTWPFLFFQFKQLEFAQNLHDCIVCAVITTLSIVIFWEVLTKTCPCCRTVWAVWKTVLDEARRVGEMRLQAADTYMQQIAEPLKPLKLEKQQVAKKVRACDVIRVPNTRPIFAVAINMLDLITASQGVRNWSGMLCFCRKTWQLWRRW